MGRARAQRGISGAEFQGRVVGMDTLWLTRPHLFERTARPGRIIYITRRDTPLYNLTCAARALQGRRPRLYAACEV